jgi:DNA-binding transcriptional regulator YiaG
MPNIIKDEIRRIAKREINVAIKGLKKDNAQLKRSNADLKRRVARLEKTVARQRTVLGQVGKQSLQADEKALEKFRFTRNTVAALRKRLSLTQGEFAKLVGASIGSVVNWEKGATPRDEQKAKILGLRKLGARQVREILEGMV